MILLIYIIFMLMSKENGKLKIELSDSTFAHIKYRFGNKEKSINV